jgi:hypothetical protein
MEAQAYTHIIQIEYQNISTPKRMQGTTVPIAVGQKPTRTTLFMINRSPLCACCGVMCHVVMSVLRLFAITQQPSGVLESYTYWYVASGKEKPFGIVLALICGFEHYEMENVHKFGQLELIQ